MISYVSGNGNSIVTVEDWISDEVFAEAVKRYREKHFPNQNLFKSNFFDGNGKAHKLATYENESGASISKTVLAYIVLEIAHEFPQRSIYNQKHKKTLRNLRDGLISVLN